MTACIAIITDFGLADGFVGVMKGVIHSIAPNTPVIDITHDIQNHSIKEAAWVLNCSYSYFGKDTIFVVVVDPAVGSSRKPIILKTGKYYFIGTDNGVFSYILRNEKIRESCVVTKKDFWLRAVSHTFHGRDIFAPVAAHLSTGNYELKNFGEAITSHTLVMLEEKSPVIKGNKIDGEVVYIDKFGNVVTNIPSRLMKSIDVEVCIGQHRIRGLSTSYAHVKQGELLAVLGSHHYLEIAANCSSAAQLTGVQVRDPVTVIEIG